MVNRERVEKVIKGELDQFIHDEKKLIVFKMQRLVAGYLRIYIRECSQHYLIPIDLSNLVAQFTSAARIDTSLFQERINIHEMKCKELLALFNAMKTQQFNIKRECEVLQDRI